MISLNLMPNGPNSRPVYNGPSDDELEAFILRLRFFIQDNEETSLRNISAILEKDPTVSEILKKEVAHVRSSLKKTFDSYPPIKVSSKSIPNPPTWHDIFETFIYGELAHANSKKSGQMKVWKKEQRNYLLFKYYFVKILVVIASGITYIADLIEAELIGSFKTI